VVEIIRIVNLVYFLTGKTVKMFYNTYKKEVNTNRNQLKGDLIMITIQRFNCSGCSINGKTLVGFGELDMICEECGHELIFTTVELFMAEPIVNTLKTN